MPKKFSFLICILSLSISLRAQKKIPEFGKIDIADLQLKSCSFEPDASAMKLFDIQETKFEIFTYGTKLKTETRSRIKIFNEKGYKYASIRIPYFSKKGIAKIKELDGAVYNLDARGKISIQKLEKKDFFKEKAMENIGIVNFTFPNLKPGSIIEFRYTTIENDIFQLNPWIIQGEIPVEYTSVELTTPVSSRIVEKVFGVDTIDQSYGLLKYDQFRRTTYFKKSILSFKPEAYMSSYKDNLIKVVFLLFPWGNSSFNYKTSSDVIWKSAGSQFLNSRYFEEQINHPITGTEKIIDSARKISAMADKINFIYEEVKKRWPGKAEQTIQAKNLLEAWTNQTGTSTEINLILLNILAKADIKCFPVLISTRDNGKVDKTFPSNGQLNGIDIIAFDSSKFYLLDASLKFQSFQNPPLNILNREAYLLSPDSMQWVTIADQRPLLKQSSDVYAEVNENGIIEGTATVQYFDYAKSYRLDTTLLNEDDDEKFMDKKPAGLKILSTKQENTGIADDPLLETIEFTYEPQNTGDFYFIDPQILTTTNKNPFLADKRFTDIDFGCNQMFILTMQIHFPSSFQPDNLPKNMTIRAPDSSFFYKVTYSTDKESIYVSQLFEVKRALFSKDEYAGIQDFFKRMYTLMAEEIILKKKK